MCGTFVPTLQLQHLGFGDQPGTV
ncbi:hypothetical protein CLOM_g23177, partial [Closterium sp. NIES-68]